MKPRRALRRPKAAAVTPPFSVIIVAGDKRGLWGRFRTIEAAAEIAKKLRAHGMHAIVHEAAP